MPFVDESDEHRIAIVIQRFGLARKLLFITLSNLWIYSGHVILDSTMESNMKKEAFQQLLCLKLRRINFLTTNYAPTYEKIIQTIQGILCYTFQYVYGDPRSVIVHLQTFVKLRWSSK